MLTICIWYSLPIRKVIAMQFQLFGPCPKGENGCVIFFFLYLYTKLLSGQNPLIWPLHIPIILVEEEEEKSISKLLQTPPNSSKPCPHLSKFFTYHRYKNQNYNCSNYV